ncbi:MAG TPA: hypothetical protein VGZ73_22560 [Bryobacteraceae bacterium]|nr:hypothetical protein [Bryobacteraceae bacterium]
MSHRTRRPTAVKQWKRDLELLRSRIGRHHDHVIERMRDDETRLLEALYSFAESNRRPLAESGPNPQSIQERLATLERCLFPARRVNCPPTR